MDWLRMGNKSIYAGPVGAKVVNIRNVQAMLMNDVKRSYARIKNAGVCVAENAPLGSHGVR